MTQPKTRLVAHHCKRVLHTALNGFPVIFARFLMLLLRCRRQNNPILFFPRYMNERKIEVAKNWASKSTPTFIGIRSNIN